MSEPWQCPACKVWNAPGVSWHKCEVIPAHGGNATAPVAEGSEALKPSTKDGRQGYNQGYEPEFLTFWNIYPLHRDKRKAQKAWRNATKRATTDAINAGAKRYRNDPNRREEFTKYAEGWLNGDGWEDEPLPARHARPLEPAAPDPHAWEEQARAFLEGGE